MAEYPQKDGKFPLPDLKQDAFDRYNEMYLVIGYNDLCEDKTGRPIGKRRYEEVKKSLGEMFEMISKSYISAAVIFASPNSKIYDISPPKDPRDFTWEDMVVDLAHLAAQKGLITINGDRLWYSTLIYKTDTFHVKSVDGDEGNTQLHVNNFMLWRNHVRNFTFDSYSRWNIASASRRSSRRCRGARSPSSSWTWAAAAGRSGYAPGRDRGDAGEM